MGQFSPQPSFAPVNTVSEPCIVGIRLPWKKCSRERLRYDRRLISSCFLPSTGVGDAWAAEIHEILVCGRNAVDLSHVLHRPRFRRGPPAWLGVLAKQAGIAGCETCGRQALGASRVIDHWKLADERNEAKVAVLKENLDALTLRMAWARTVSAT